MEILLDTHVLLWWLAYDPRLSGHARDLVSDPANLPVVSAASAWEIAIKRALGKLAFQGDLEREVQAQGFSKLPITLSHAAEAATLPALHRDPFDRMLVAQARLEGMSLLTADRRILQYPANVIAA